MNHVYQDIIENRLSEVVERINWRNEEIVAVTFLPPSYGTTGYYTIFTRDKQEVE